jgi:polyisoprenyl-phosphate glycosyltransferase
MAGSPPPELSFVVPCYNEEGNVELMCEALIREGKAHARSFEIILIDNGSTDSTRDKIRDICASTLNVRAIFNTRNFGQMRSPTHALYQTRGNAVIGLCADFQDPPAMIGEFVRLWRQGAPIVLGQRRNEKVSLSLRIARSVSYILLARFADYEALPQVTGFGLYDRKVVDQLASWNEPEPFFRGMLVESGYPITLIPFDRPERKFGKTSNTFSTLLDFALASLASSSRRMMRLPLIWAPFAGLLAALFVIAGVIALFFEGPAFALASLGLQIGLFSILLLFLGLLGVQIRTISDRTRGMPLVVEEERINFPKPGED